MKITQLFLLAMALSACSNMKLPQYKVIQGLRVLALASDSPELLYDGTTFTPNSVNITPWVSDVFGAGRALKYNVEWCLDPGIALGVIPSCSGNPTRTVVASDQAVAASADFLAPNYTGSLADVTVDFSLASAAAQAIISARFLSAKNDEKYNGLSLLVIYEIYVSNEPSKKITSFKRIIISDASKPVKNSNPSGLEIRQSGVEITALPSINASLEAYLPSAQAESFSVMNPSGTLTAKVETLETTWFLTGPEDVECSNKKDCTTDGLFSLTRTRLGEFNSFSVPLQGTPAARGRVLISVARDGRGGMMGKRYCTGACP